jgi:photosystem I subunit III
VVKQASTALAAVALASVVSFGTVDAAYADVAGLTPCSESKGFAKREAQQLKKLEKRSKQVRIV